MAVVAWSRVWQAHEGSADIWEVVLTFAGTDTAGWLVLPWKADKTVHVYGTFTGSLSLVGTLEVSSNPTAAGILTDPGGTALTFTGATVPKAVLPNCYQYGVTGTPGSGAATIRLMAARGGQ